MFTIGGENLSAPNRHGNPYRGVRPSVRGLPPWGVGREGMAIPWGTGKEGFGQDDPQSRRVPLVPALASSCPPLRFYKPKRRP